MKGELFVGVLLCLAARSHAAMNPERCCPDDAIMLPEGRCPNATSRVSLAACRHGHFLLSDIIVKKDGLTTKDTDGFFFATNEDKFCVGRRWNSSNPNDTLIVSAAVVCYDEIEPPPDVELLGILTIISVGFLVLTITVYLFLPELRDLQGKCIMCMCACMALGFLNLGVTQLGYGYQKAICSLNGFMIYFWMMATFFWMNVVSFNVYRSATSHRGTESRPFLHYNLYAWGCSCALLVVVLITNYVEGDHLSPGFGVKNCWFKGVTETWAYFYGPVAVLIAANIALFVLTSIRLWRTSKNYEVSTLKRLRYKFLLYLKLFIVMGLSWVFEIASFAHAEEHIIWRLADIFNCLQGVVFFVLLVVLRRRALRGLAERGVGGACGRRLAQRLDAAGAGDDADSMVDASEHEEDDGDRAAPYRVALDGGDPTPLAPSPRQDQPSNRLS